jgi:protoporphyrinogen oxidase
MLGIAVALELADSGREVTIFEAASHVGGLVAPWSIGDLTWDRYYHVTLASDRNTRALLRRAGVDDLLQLRSTSTGYWDGAAVHRADTVREFLALPGLSLVSKLRIGATIALNARRRDWRRIERVTVDRWLRRWSGRAAFDRFWEAQLRAKLGDEHRDVAASFLWATFRRLDGARRGVERREQMGYVRGGYATTIEGLDEALRSAGVELVLDAPVSALDHRDGSVLVTTQSGTRAFDDVVVTLAAPLAAGLVEHLDHGAASSLRSVRTMGVVCASAVFARPVSAHYLTYLAAPTPLTAVVDMSALVDAVELADRGLVYLPRYVPSDDPLFERSDDDLRDEWLGALGAICPDLETNELVAFAVARARHVFAVPGVGYSDRVPPLTIEGHRIHLVGSAHLVHATLNVDETVALGTWAARELVSSGRIDRDRLLARP